MSNYPDSTQFEAAKIHLIASLRDVASHMRNAAILADQFAATIPHAPYTAVGYAPNGQYVTPATSRKRKSDDSEEEDGKKKKRVARKLKDPNAPKRPASSYIFFQNELRTELKKKFPNMHNTEIVAEVSKRWAEMTMDEKEIYTKKSALAKKKYEEDKKVYEGLNAAPAAIPVAILAPVPETPAVATSSSPTVSKAEESSEEESESDAEEAEEEEDDDSDDSEDEEPVPEPKKSKSKGKAEPATPAPAVKKAKAAAPSTSAVTPAPKEKKPRKTKA